MPRRRSAWLVIVAALVAACGGGGGGETVATVDDDAVAEWLTAGVFDRPIDERAAVHNLEHGAVAVYLSPDLDAAEVEEVAAWATERNAAGLLDERTGAGLLVAPWEEPLEPPVAVRAWGVAADCARFDATFADGFVRDRFGTAGDAPEGHLGGDPSDVIADADA